MNLFLRDGYLSRWMSLLLAWIHYSYLIHLSRYSVSCWSLIRTQRVCNLYKPWARSDGDDLETLWGRSGILPAECLDFKRSLSWLNSRRLWLGHCSWYCQSFRGFEASTRCFFSAQKSLWIFCGLILAIFGLRKMLFCELAALWC